MEDSQNKNSANYIYESSYKDVVNYYNKFDDYFIEFSQKVGFDVWFLNQFRTYMNYRNVCLSNSKPHNSEQPSVVKISRYVKLSRLLKECFYILIRCKPFAKLFYSDYWILSSNKSNKMYKSGRFGDIDKRFPQINNRPGFDLKNNVEWSDFSGKRQLSSDDFFVKYLLKFTFIRELITFGKQLKSLKNQIDNKIVKNDSETEKSIHKIFWGNKNVFYYYYLRYRAFDSFFAKTKPKGILLVDENSPQQVVIRNAANKNNVKVFAFQHGNIYTEHPAYGYYFYNNKPLLSDITFTWGKYFTQLLVEKCGYEPHQVSTSGRLSKKEKPIINTKINAQKDVLLYASQPNPNQTVRRQILYDVLCAAKSLSDRYSLVIRPHPREIDNDFFNQVAKSVGFEDFIIDRESNLMGIFSVCKVLLVDFSTVGTEFIKYYKPLIVMDYLNLDLMHWIRDGVGIRVSNGNELIKVLSFRELSIDKEKYNSFIENYYIDDDMVEDRVMKAIYE